MKMLRFGVSVLFLLLAPGLAAGQSLPQAPPGEPPRSGEGLELRIPPGWAKMDTVRNEKREEVYLVPPGQNSPNWKDMVAFREVKGYSGGGPKEVLEGSLASARQGCPQLGFRPIQEGVVNGYPAAFLLVYCPSDPSGKGGEVNLVKVIVGRENLYMVQRTWRTTPFDPGSPPIDSQTLDIWVKYLSHLKPCDTRDSKHPC